MKSKKPRKKRKEFIEMSSHKRVKSISAHLNEKLGKELGKRSISLRKGDTVKIVRGSFKGKEGKINRVDHGLLKIFIEKIVRKRSDGAEFQVPVDPSNTIVVDIDKSDRKRMKRKKSEEK